MARVFPSPFHSGRTPIGIDVGNDAVRAIQLDTRSGGIKAMAKMALPGSGDRGAQRFSQLLRRTLRKQGFRGTRCVLSAPRNLIFVHPIRVPKMPNCELAECLAWEAAERFAIDRDSLQVDGILSGARPSGHGDDRSEVILFALNQSAAAPWLESILDAGYAPLVLEPGFCAVARTHSQMYRRERDRSHVRVILDVAAGGSTLIYLRGDQIGFCKSFAIGGDQLDEAVAARLSLDPESAKALRRDRRLAQSGGRQVDPAADSGAEEAVMPLIHELASEVSLCLRHCAVAFSGSRPQEMIISGRDACEPGLAQLLESRIGFTVATDDEQQTVHEISKSLATRGIRAEDPSAWTAAMGLAIRPLHARADGYRRGRAA